MILNLHEFQKMKRITDKNLLVKLYLAKEKHWLRTIIITSVAGTISFISSIVMKIMDSSGVGKTDNTTGLVSNNTDNSLTLICAIISLVLFLVFFIMVLFIQISDVVYAKYSANISKNKDLNFNLDLIEKTNKVCEEKFNTLVGVIDDVKLGKIEPPAIVNKPCNQLRNICNAISDILESILNGNNIDVPEKDVRVNAIYCLPNELGSGHEWTLAHSQKFDYDKLSDIIDNENSLFNHARKLHTNIVMRNDKSEAYKAQEYVPCNADKTETSDLNGSILYYKIPVKDNKGKTIVDIMIMVYTCRNKFPKAGSEDIAKYNIETVLLRFESRIKIEMCLYYLYYLHENESN